MTSKLQKSLVCLSFSMVCTHGYMDDMNSFQLLFVESRGIPEPKTICNSTSKVWVYLRTFSQLAHSETPPKRGTFRNIV